MREGYFKDARVITGQNILTAKSRGRPRRSVALPTPSVPGLDRVCFISVPALQPHQLPFAALFALLERCRARDPGHGGVRGRAAGRDGGEPGHAGAGQLCCRQQAASLLPGTATDSPEQFITASSVATASAVNMSVVV